MGSLYVILTSENVHVITGGVLPVLAQQWMQAVWGVQCRFAGGGGAGGTRSQETQHHPLQGTAQWLILPIGTTSVVNRTMSSCNPPSFTFAYNIPMAFLLVKVCALAACSPPSWKCMPLVDLLNGLLWPGQNGLPPTPDTLHLGCSYLLHPSHRFLSTWGVVRLEI